MSANDSRHAFVDTNILLYAHDHQAGEKHVIAAKLLASLWEDRRGTLSPQVLQEFLVNAIRKRQHPIALAQARDIVRAYGAWVARDTGVDDILRATELMELTGYSFWDSLILASAESSGAECLYSEDMQHGHKVAGLEICNPFMHANCV